MGAPVARREQARLRRGAPGAADPPTARDQPAALARPHHGRSASRTAIFSIRSPTRRLPSRRSSSTTRESGSSNTPVSRRVCCRGRRCPRKWSRSGRAASSPNGGSIPSSIATRPPRVRAGPGRRSPIPTRGCAPGRRRARLADRDPDADGYLPVPPPRNRPGPALRSDQRHCRPTPWPVDHRRSAKDPGGTALASPFTPTGRRAVDVVEDPALPGRPV